MTTRLPQTTKCDIRVENGTAIFTADFEGNVWKWSIPIDNLAQAMGMAYLDSSCVPLALPAKEAEVNRR